MTALNKLLQRVSLTGPDDKTDYEDLRRLAQHHPYVEWALLFVPHNEGAPRNPTKVWREGFFDAKVGGFSAVHLCGSLAFEQLLKGTLPSDVLRADRLQLNINARKREFSDAQVLQVFHKALQLGPDIILQVNDDTAAPVSQFLAGLADSERPRVHALLDASKGLGVLPSHWSVPDYIGTSFVGFAGGLGPANVAPVLMVLDAFGRPYYIDMESGVRTDNQFDLNKAELVLQAAAPFIARGAVS